MRSGVVVLSALAVVALADAPSRAQPGRRDQEAARQGWLFSLEEGKNQARKSNKPLMVVIRCVP